MDIVESILIYGLMLSHFECSQEPYNENVDLHLSV